MLFLGAPLAVLRKWCRIPDPSRDRKTSAVFKKHSWFDSSPSLSTKIQDGVWTEWISSSVPCVGLGFELLDNADQSVLLSCSSVEVMFLLSAQWFAEDPSQCNAGNLVSITTKGVRTYNISCSLSVRSILSSALYPVSGTNVSCDWMKISQSRSHQTLLNSGKSLLMVLVKWTTNVEHSLIVRVCEFFLSFQQHMSTN